MIIPDVAVHKQEIEENGYSAVPGVFTAETVKSIADGIAMVDRSNRNFRQSEALFAIRQLFKEVPGVIPLIFTKAFIDVVTNLLGNNYFVVKSIYFDKPEQSNWFVAYHQDLTISVDKRTDIEGFGPWTAKQDQFAVQPPLDYLENIVTIRIHLDDTDEGNGALKVIPGSHKKGIYRPETIDWNTESEAICAVPAGGIMVMKPLLLHASGRSTNQKRRRVIHIEFSNKGLPAELQWSEKQLF